MGNIYRNLETLSLNTCRLHGCSPKSSSATVSPLHRVQNLDLMDDIRLPFPKENHTNSPVSITPTILMEQHQIHHQQLQLQAQQALLQQQHQQQHHHHHHHQQQQQQQSSMTPSRSFRQQTSLHQNNSDLASSNKTKSSGNCCSGPGGSRITTDSTTNSATAGGGASTSNCCGGADGASSSNQQHGASKADTSPQLKYRWHGCPELHKAMDGVTYIADHTKKEEESTKVSYIIIIMYFNLSYP